MGDDWYGHRDFRNGRPIGDKDEWLEWDFCLMNTLQIIEDNTDDYGILAWEREDERVEIDADKRIHKFKAAVDRATTGTEKHPYKPSPGEYFLPNITSRGRNGEIQTYGEWIEKMSEASEEA